jgi:hypothetical protein
VKISQQTITSISIANAHIILTRTPPPEKGFLPSRTCRALQEMWSAHAPELWIFGHYHISFDHLLHRNRETGCRFIGLAELEYRDIDLRDI